MRARSPHLQYDEKTSALSKWFASAVYDVSDGKIEVSPKQMDYLIRSYTGVIGQVGLPAATPSTYQGGSTAEKLLRPITSQFTADPLYSNQTITDFYDEMDRLNTIAADKNFSEELPGEVTTPEERRYSAMTKASKAMSELSRLSQNATNPEETRKYIIYIAQNALAAVKRDMPYVPPLKISEKDSKGNNKRDEDGATIYKYLSVNEYKLYQTMLNTAYTKVTSSQFYKDKKTDAEKAKYLTSHMTSETDDINKKFLRK